MMWQRKEKASLNFLSRSEAFLHILTEEISRGTDPIEAANKANIFANIFAENMGVPEQRPTTEEGIDKVLSYVTKIEKCAEEHPKIAEFVTGAITFAFGAITEKFLQKKEPVPNASEITEEVKPIDFSTIPE